MQEEWMGQTSSKFRGHKLHVPQPDYKETKHPLFQAEQRKHFPSQVSHESKWKSSIRLNKDTHVSPCIDEYIPPKYKVERVFTETKERAEKKHITAKPSEAQVELGLKTFVDIHNKKSVNEFS